MLKDFDLLIKISTIFSQQDIALKIGHPREVVNRWLKDEKRLSQKNWLTYEERINLESMLPAKKIGNHEFTFIDLFAGIGGIRKGFETAGGKCLFTSEYDKYAVKTYLANHYCDHEINGDIREITQPKDIKEEQINSYIDSKIPDHDVLLAGFPCQPFSIAGVSKKNSLGRSHGFEDETQGTLFFDIARIIKAKKPIALMLENVKNLKSHDRGRTFNIIIKTLDSLGYEIADKDFNKSTNDPKIINGKNFVPQNRERIVLVALRKDLGGVGDLTLCDIKNYFPPMEPKVADILDPEDTIEDKYILTKNLWTYLENYAKKHKAAGNGFGFGMVTREDRSTRTLSARYYKDGSEILVDRGPKNRPRRLTPHECARLMGFDKSKERKFVIPVSDMQAYKQFGNSVVVPVFEAVAMIMRPYIINAKKRNKSKA